MKNEVITLISVTKAQDEDGFETETQTESEVMAEIKSVGRTEFYQAAHEGIKVAIVAVVNVDDFNAPTIRPTKVKYDGDMFLIIRQYKTNKYDIELTLSQVETDGGVES